MSDMPALYLDIDLSTQSVTGVFLDERFALAALSVNFDAEFSECAPHSIHPAFHPPRISSSLNPKP